MIDKIVIEFGIGDLGEWEEGIVVEIVMHVIIIGTMLVPSHLHTFLDPPCGGVWVLLYYLFEVVRFAPLPVPLDEKDVDAAASVTEVRFGGLGPLVTNGDTTAEVIVKTDLRKTSIAEDEFGITVESLIEWLDILLDGRVVKGFGSREMQEMCI